MTPKQRQWVVYGVATWMFVFTGLLVIMLWNTFSPVKQPPLKVVGVTLDVVKTGKLITVLERRTFEGDIVGDIVLQRHLWNQSNPYDGVQLEGGHIGLDDEMLGVRKNGQFDTFKVIPIPIGSTGVWCSGADMVWYPFLSMRPRVYELEHKCFTVPK